MIVELSVENLAIIEKAQIAPGPGFTVLTGETGAGKSLLVDALELALGERADTELVRHGSPRASVSLAIDLSGSRSLMDHAAELGLPLEEGTLFIQRDVFAEGRSQCRVAGKLMPVSALKQLGAKLVDLHGQHEHQSLLHAESHQGYLDDWIGQPALSLLEQVDKAYGKARRAEEILAATRASLRDREQRLDLLNFQIGEIEAADPQPGEMDGLESRLARLKHGEKLSEATLRALDLIQRRDGAAVEQIGQAAKELESALRFDPELAKPLEPLRSALESLQDGALELDRYADALEADPNALEDVATRIDLLKRLRRKYGEDEAAVIAYLEDCRQELQALADEGASEESLAAAVEAAKESLRSLCKQLSGLRQKKSKEFSALVQAQLRDLAMERAVFEVRMTPKEPATDGADLIEFFFSANAGEPPRPLGRIASGGEISRVMLAIKTAFAGKAGVPTLVFDEVDAGLGGRVAATVAAKLEELSSHYQVLVISHLPQIAARATTHYRVEKVQSNGREVTQARRLDPDERAHEIARMLAGEKVTSTALASARELLDEKAPVAR